MDKKATGGTDQSTTEAAITAMRALLVDVFGVPRDTLPALDEAAVACMRAAVWTALDVLSARDVLVLTLRYGLDGGGPRTLREVGAVIGRSPERSRAIQARALRMLRHPSRSGPLQEFTVTPEEAARREAERAERHAQTDALARLAHEENAARERDRQTQDEPMLAPFVLTTVSAEGRTYRLDPPLALSVWRQGDGSAARVLAQEPLLGTQASSLLGGPIEAAERDHLPALVAARLHERYRTFGPDAPPPPPGTPYAWLMTFCRVTIQQRMFPIAENTC